MIEVHKTKFISHLIGSAKFLVPVAQAKPKCFSQIPPKPMDRTKSTEPRRSIKAKSELEKRIQELLEPRSQRSSKSGELPGPKKSREQQEPAMEDLTMNLRKTADRGARREGAKSEAGAANIGASSSLPKVSIDNIIPPVPVGDVSNNPAYHNPPRARRRVSDVKESPSQYSRSPSKSASERSTSSGYLGNVPQVPQGSRHDTEKTKVTARGHQLVIGILAAKQLAQTIPHLSIVRAQTTSWSGYEWIGPISRTIGPNGCQIKVFQTRIRPCIHSIQGGFE